MLSNFTVSGLRYSSNPLSAFELSLLSLAHKNSARKKNVFRPVFGGPGNLATLLEHSWGGQTTGMFMSPASRTRAIMHAVLGTNVFTVEKDSAGLRGVWVCESVHSFPLLGHLHSLHWFSGLVSRCNYSPEKWAAERFSERL